MGEPAPPPYEEVTGGYPGPAPPAGYAPAAPPYGQPAAPGYAPQGAGYPQQQYPQQSGAYPVPGSAGYPAGYPQPQQYPPGAGYGAQPGQGYPQQPGYPPQQYPGYKPGPAPHQAQHIIIAQPVNMAQGPYGAMNAQTYEQQYRSTGIMAGITCLFCCCPLGTLALYRVYQSNEAASQGQHAIASAQIAAARRIAGCGVAIGIFFYIFLVIRNIFAF